MATDPTLLPTQNSPVPPDMLGEYQKLLRQRQMAQMLFQQAMAPRPTEVVTGHAVRQSPLSAIARALSMYGGSQGLASADTGLAGLAQKSDEQRRAAIAQFLSDPETQYQQAMQNPATAGMAKEWLDKRAKMVSEGAGLIGKEGGDVASALAALQSQKLPGNWAPPPPGPVQFGQQGENQYAIIPGTGGKQELKWAPKGTNVSVDARQAGREQEMALASTEADLKERRSRAQAAKETLSANRVALEALNDGAKSGGLEGFKQSLRKVAQGFGIASDDTTPTEQLQMALGNAVLAKARALAPVTAEDVKRLETILGSINTDPQALQKMLAVYNGIAAKELQDYNRYVETQRNSLTNPLARDLFSGAAIGFEMQPPPGNTYQGLRAIQELQSRGGDVSNFAVGGEPIPPGATFKLGPPPGEKGAAPAASPGQLDPNKVYTIDELRKLGVIK